MTASGVIALILVAFAVIAIVKSTAFLNAKLEKQLAKTVMLAETTLPNALWQFNNDYIHDFVDSLFLDEEIVYVRISSNNELITSKTQPKYADNDFVFFVNSPKYITKSSEIIYEKYRVGRIEIAFSREYIQKAAQKNTLVTFALVLVIISAISLALYYSIHKRVLAPLIQLEQSAESIAKGDLDRPIDIKSDDEIGHLAKSFDRMRQAVKDSVEKIKKTDELAEINRKLQKEIIERKQAEERFRLAAQATSDLVYEWKLDENSHGWFGDIDTALGYKNGEFTHTIESWVERIHPDDQSRLAEAVEFHKTSVKPIHYEYRIQRKDGSYRLWSDSGIPVLGEDGLPTKWIGVCSDITEKKQAATEKDRLSTELRKNRKMQAVGTLAGGVAHGFNNMLAIIMGSIEMAQDSESNDEFTNKQLDRALRASLDAKELIKQILTFSRQKMDRKMESLNLAVSLRKTLELISSSLPSSIDLNKNITSDCQYIRADSSEIIQIMMDLCSNAVWAMKEKGVNTVSLDQTEIDGNSLTNLSGLKLGIYLRLSVSDTGEGMDATTQERVFDPFFTTKDVGQGTGMGLATVLGIMDSYGGTITVDSVIGSGTTFTLYFPAIEDVAVEKEQGRLEDDSMVPKDVPTGNKRILFVDDEELYNETCTELLKRLGYFVTATTSSVEALEYFRATPDDFDLVITDQIMPHLSGDDLSKELLAVRPEIPIILCTGYSTQINEEKAQSLGIREYALKPLVTKDIALLIRKVFESV